MIRLSCWGISGGNMIKDENKEEKIYKVKLDLGLTKEQAEYLVDKIIMPVIFPDYTQQRSEFLSQIIK